MLEFPAHAQRPRPYPQHRSRAILYIRRPLDEFHQLPGRRKPFERSGDSWNANTRSAGASILEEATNTFSRAIFLEVILHLKLPRECFPELM